MTIQDIEHLEYTVASSFKELVKLTSLSYALSMANALIRDVEINKLVNIKKDQEDGSTG
jgi:hypothetical protein